MTTENLNEFFSRLIAEHEGIDKSAITPEYIKKKREILERDMRFNICSEYGGYNTNGLEVLTRKEIEEINKEAIEWIEQF